MSSALFHRHKLYRKRYKDDHTKATRERFSTFYQYFAAHPKPETRRHIMSAVRESLPDALQDQIYRLLRQHLPNPTAPITPPQEEAIIQTANRLSFIVKGNKLYNGDPSEISILSLTSRVSIYDSSIAVIVHKDHKYQPVFIASVLHGASRLTALVKAVELVMTTMFEGWMMDNQDRRLSLWVTDGGRADFFTSLLPEYLSVNTDKEIPEDSVVSESVSITEDAE